MFDPPAELHQQFEAALLRMRAQLDGEHPMWIGGRARHAATQFEVHAPIDRELRLGRFARGMAVDAADAVAAACAARKSWAATPWPERVHILLRAAALIEQRVYDIAAAVALEVGKNRMEALGEVQETADLVRWYCAQMQANEGFDHVLPDDPLPGWRSRNRTRLRPHGAWAVIAPFNFPFALAGGPIAAALVAGNTVVFKVASDTAWSGVLLMQAFHDAGVPEGVLNHVMGPGGEIGNALAADVRIAGLTFTGSYAVGMGIVRAFAARAWPQPCIAEMGGKNAVIVSAKADLDKAAMGIMRSAFGLSGQKCSAASRVYVEAPVKDALLQKLVDLTSKMAVGDPTRQDVFMGPAANKGGYKDYQRFAELAARDGTIAFGGHVLTEGDYAKGYFVAPTIIDDLPLDHELWQVEMFLPLVAVGAVPSLEVAMREANHSAYGLTGGFFSEDKEEVQWYLDHIEAGVVYTNRAGGATTGAWPGYQTFGGWKGSGSTGKNGGGPYYVQQYMHEQSQTVLD